MSSQRLFQPLIAMQGRDATRNVTAERTVKKTKGGHQKVNHGRVEFLSAAPMKQTELSSNRHRRHT
jgi:hypothetical protein